MVEILWNSEAPHSPTKDHEMVELRVVELGGGERPSFLVREIHAAWSAAAQQIEWKGFADERFETPQEAHRSYLNRQRSILKSGFRYCTILD
jgi:hypothetical protein